MHAFHNDSAPQVLAHPHELADTLRWSLFLCRWWNCALSQCPQGGLTPYMQLLVVPDGRVALQKEIEVSKRSPHHLAQFDWGVTVFGPSGIVIFVSQFAEITSPTSRWQLLKTAVYRDELWHLHAYS
jgi:hypothetical protein